MAVQGQAVRRVARSVRGPVVEDPFGHVDVRRDSRNSPAAGSRCRGPRPTRSRAVRIGQRGRLPGSQVRHARVAPEPQLSVLRADRHRVAAAVDGEDVSGQRVLGIRPLGLIATDVPPRSRPRRDRGRSSRRRASPCSRRASGSASRWPSMLVSQRVFQNTSLPLKNARCTPAARAASTLARCPPDQYSSWPTDRNASCSRSSLAIRSRVDTA